MRIGYFGGSFDPPHLGHLAVARAAASAFMLDTVLFVPTGRQPLKPDGLVAGYADRLAMVSLLCEPSPQDVGGAAFVASALESPLPDQSAHYTVNTLLQLKSTLQADDVVFVLVGADAFLQLHKWRSPQLLLDLAEWIVISRPGFDLALSEMGFTRDQNRHLHLLPNLADPTTATSIRTQLAHGASDAALLNSLPLSVLQYIRLHNLYAESSARPFSR